MRPQIPSLRRIPDEKPRTWITCLTLIVVLAGLALCLAGCSCAAPTQGWQAEDFLSVSFPPVKLATDEYIESVELELQDGMIATINWIPPDWHLDARWDTPNLTLLNLWARHFGSGLTSGRDLDGFITVQAGHPTRFEVKARLLTEIPNPTEPKCRTNFFTQSNLIFRPVSRPENLSRSHVMEVEFLKKYTPPPPFVTERGEHVVRRGDSLASIAKLYGLSISELTALNPGLQGEEVKVGQLIRIRKNQRE